MKKQQDRKNIINTIKQSKDRINQAILANQSYLVNQLIKNNLDDFQFENINLTFKEVLDYESIIIDYLKDQKLISKRFHSLNYETFVKYQSEIEQFLESETDYFSNKKEYYEAWLVDSWFFGKLEAKGELIINYSDQEQWWGRKMCGQNVFLDSVVQEITLETSAFNMDLEFSEFHDLLKVHGLKSSNLVCNINRF